MKKIVYALTYQRATAAPDYNSLNDWEKLDRIRQERINIQKAHYTEYFNNFLASANVLDSYVCNAFPTLPVIFGAWLTVEQIKQLEHHPDLAFIDVFEQDGPREGTIGKTLQKAIENAVEGEEFFVTIDLIDRLDYAEVERQAYQRATAAPDYNSLNDWEKLDRFRWERINIVRAYYTEYISNFLASANVSDDDADYVGGSPRISKVYLTVEQIRQLESHPDLGFIDVVDETPIVNY